PWQPKPVMGQGSAPSALFWFRWAAAATVLFGVITALLNGYFFEALTFQRASTIGIGMWLALIMAANVWFVIRPNQQKVLGLVEGDAATKKRAGRVALLAARPHTVVSIPHV